MAKGEPAPRALKNILVRDLTAADNDMIRTVMRETGCHQASKAVMKAAYSLVRMSALTNRQTARIKELEAENQQLRHAAETIAGAALELGRVLSKTR